MDVELSQRVRDLVVLALQNNVQKRLVRREAEKLYKKLRFRSEFQHGHYEGLKLTSYAAKGGHQLLMEILLDCCHIDPKIPDSIFGTTTLHHAAVNGQTEMVNTLVTRYSCPVDDVDSCGSTPLCLAIMKGQVNTCNSLIDLGASLEVNSIYGAPLHIAGFAGSLSLVQRLREMGPQAVNHELYGFCTPIIAAMCGSSIECVDYLAQFSNVQHLAYKALVCYSTEEDMIECLDTLLNHGMDPNIYDQALYEEVPIVFAARHGWRNVVEMLLPLSTQIDGVTWSVDGLLEHVCSERFKVMAKEQKETRLCHLRNRCIQEIRNIHFLAAEYILKVLRLEMPHEDFVLLKSLHGVLGKLAVGSYRMRFSDDAIRAYGFTLLHGNDGAGALEAAQACLALDRDKQENKEFMMRVMRNRAATSSMQYGAGTSSSGR